MTFILQHGALTEILFFFQVYVGFVVFSINVAMDLFSLVNVSELETFDRNIFFGRVIKGFFN